MEYYLAIKRNEILIHATTQMNLENMLSERSQSQKTTLFFLFERESASRGGASREGDRGSKAGSALIAASPLWGLKSQTVRS